VLNWPDKTHTQTHPGGQPCSLLLLCMYVCKSSASQLIAHDSQDTAGAGTKVGDLPFNSATPSLRRTSVLLHTDMLNLQQDPPAHCIHTGINPNPHRACSKSLPSSNASPPTDRNNFINHPKLFGPNPKSPTPILLLRFGFQEFHSDHSHQSDDNARMLVARHMVWKGVLDLCWHKCVRGCCTQPQRTRP
jgi:hypothetical protein